MISIISSLSDCLKGTEEAYFPDLKIFIQEKSIIYYFGDKIEALNIQIEAKYLACAIIFLSKESPEIKVILEKIQWYYFKL